jgi:hypothetical protein
VTGVRAGDRVVLDGRQNVRPGAPVVERPADDAAAASAAGTGRRRGAASAPADASAPDAGAPAAGERTRPASGVSAHEAAESARLAAPLAKGTS